MIKYIQNSQPEKKKSNCSYIAISWNAYNNLESFLK
jgi:hypothetical protein